MRALSYEMPCGSRGGGSETVSGLLKKQARIDEKLAIAILPGPARPLRLELLFKSSAGNLCGDSRQCVLWMQKPSDQESPAMGLLIALFVYKLKSFK